MNLPGYPLPNQPLQQTIARFAVSAAERQPVRLTVMTIMTKLVSTILILVLFVGCATPYQGSGFRGGYAETQFSENAFQVTFDGNGYSGTQRTVDFCLLRCAELAQEHGFLYFITVEQAQSGSTSYKTRGSLNGDTFSSTTHAVVKPSTSNTILCFMEKPEINGVVYSTEFVIRSIREKYEL